MKFFYKIVLKIIFDIIYGKISKFDKKYNKYILNVINLKFVNKNYKFYELIEGRIFKSGPHFQPCAVLFADASLVALHPTDSV